LGAGFVGRGFVGEKTHLIELLETSHHGIGGFSIVDILQPCVTFNKVATRSVVSDRRLPTRSGGKLQRRRQRGGMRKGPKNGGNGFPSAFFTARNARHSRNQWSALKAGPLVRQPVDSKSFEKAINEFI